MKLFVWLGLIVLAVIIFNANQKETFTPDAPRLAQDVKKTFTQFMDIPRGSVDHVAIAEAEIVSSKQSGMMSAISMQPMWSVRLRAKPKLVTKTGIFVGRSVFMDGTGATEDDAIYDAKRGMSVFRQELQNLL